LKGREQSGEPIALSREDSDTFELLGLLYTEIGRELREGTASSTLMERLQVPLLRVALQDREFFVRQHHPARQLLNAVAESGARWLADDDADPAAVRAARTFRQIDAAATGPIHGFADADDYYARSSCLPYLSRIRVPTLAINARDDPFEPREVLELAGERASDAVRFAFTDHGGHVGWVVGSPWAARSWGEDLAVEWLARAGALVQPTGGL